MRNKEHKSTYLSSANEEMINSSQPWTSILLVFCWSYQRLLVIARGSLASERVHDRLFSANRLLGAIAKRNKPNLCTTRPGTRQINSKWLRWVSVFTDFLGVLGITTSTYTYSFFPFLCRSGNLMPCLHFLGFVWWNIDNESVVPSETGVTRRRYLWLVW